MKCKIAVAILLLATCAVAQMPLEPFSFKNLKLGINLQDFEAPLPGQWNCAGRATIRGSPDLKPSHAKNCTWQPDVECKEMFKNFRSCKAYRDTIASIPADVTVYFVDDKLAMIHLLVLDTGPTQVNGRLASTGDPIWQGLISKFGPPQSSNVRPFITPRCISFMPVWHTKLWCTPEGRNELFRLGRTGQIPDGCMTLDQLCALPSVHTQYAVNNDCPPKRRDQGGVLSCVGQESAPPIRILRWDNGVSIISFNNNYGFEMDQSLHAVVKQILDGRCCSSSTPEPPLNTSAATIWYIHKELASLMFVRLQEAKAASADKARSDF